MTSKFNHAFSFITMLFLLILFIIDGIVGSIPIYLLYLSLGWFIFSFLWMLVHALKTHHIAWEYDTIIQAVAGIMSIMKLFTMIQK